jgi:hypothetical protein
MKGISHDNRLKSCSQSGGGGEQFPASKPGEANHRAVMRMNLIEPRYATMGVASMSKNVKPAPLPHPTTYRQWTPPGSSRTARWERFIRNLGSPSRAARLFVKGMAQLLTGINNRVRSRAGKSERVIVAWKPSNFGGAKDPWPITCRLRKYSELIGNTQ